MKTLIQTRTLAIESHGNQQYNGKPYSYHLDQVFDLVCEAHLDDDFKYAAYLHDTIEDTAITKQYIIDNYNENIAQMVFCVSGFGANRREKHADIVEKLSQNISYVDLKMADRIVNMRNCMSDNNSKLFKMYMGEMDSYKNLFKHGCQYYQDIFEKEFNYPIGKTAGLKI